MKDEFKRKKDEIAKETEKRINKIKENAAKKKEAISDRSNEKMYILKIVEDLKGKEIIDVNGNKVGEVSDVNWNFESNKVESIIAIEGGAAKIGLGKKLVISYGDINSIGDKILLKKAFKK
ncbi:MAG: PRC-barrel domain-containing protein [Methanobacterium sp.]